MSHPYSSKFKELQRTWYKKLKESGFEDIEDTESKNEYLKSWDSLRFQVNYTPDTFESRRHYYDTATLFLNTHLFTDELEQKIWSLHADGLSIRNIARELKTKACRIYIVINNLTKKMQGQP